MVTKPRLVLGTKNCGTNEMARFPSLGEKLFGSMVGCSLSYCDSVPRQPHRLLQTIEWVGLKSLALAS